MGRGGNESYPFLSFLTQCVITQYILKQLIFSLWAPPEMITVTSLIRFIAVPKEGAMSSRAEEEQFV